jgi:hypothetical protein
MAILERVWVIHTTSNAEDANTGENFSLEIQTANQVADMDFPDLAKNERERGTTDEYEFDLRNYNIDHRDANPGSIRMTIHGSNAWLPRSIWVIGRTEDDRYHLLVARPNWPSNAWFSTDASEGRATRPLDQN